MLKHTLAAGLLGLSLVGCAMAQGGPAAAADTAKGKALVDARGVTLYAFDKDSGGKSVCNGPCAANWPAFKATDAAAAPGWSKITRDEAFSWIDDNLGFAMVAAVDRPTLLALAEESYRQIDPAAVLPAVQR